MQFEMRALTEFTRIFPPEKKATDKGFTEECELEEEEGTSYAFSRGHPFSLSFLPSFLRSLISLYPQL
jgi:hypothetical protein